MSRKHKVSATQLFSYEQAIPVEYLNLRFLITDKPTEATLNSYIEELKRRRVTDVVRVCESTYSAKRMEQAGLSVHDWAFDDGTPPPQKVIDDWLNLIQERFKDLPTESGKQSSASGGGSNPSSPNHARNSSAGGADNGGQRATTNSPPCIAVHCVAGLGRAPVLVAIALIEAGMKYEDAVEMIRDVRRGAINAKQLQYLSTYKPKKVLVQAAHGNIKKKGCAIM